jgi:mRNA interferase MazF
MTAPAYVPKSGDLIWTDFDPIRGREQAGRRPALVVSAAIFTENTGLAVVCPITSRTRPFPTSVVLPAGLPVVGEILLSHIRSSDTQAPSHSLCRRRCAMGNRPFGSSKAEQYYHDLTAAPIASQPGDRCATLGITSRASSRIDSRHASGLPL